MKTAAAWPSSPIAHINAISSSMTASFSKTAQYDTTKLRTIKLTTRPDDFIKKEPDRGFGLLYRARITPDMLYREFQ